MKKIFSFWLLCVGLLPIARAQMVTTVPLFPSPDAPVTITFDVTQSNDVRAQGLLGLSSGVFLWSGAGTAANPFQFQPPGQTNFGAPFVPGTMTSLGNDRWSITLTPRTYVNAPPAAPLTMMGTLLKNANGSAQTEDVLVPLFDPAQFNARIFAPTQDFLLVAAGDTVAIFAAASQNATLRLFDGATLLSEVTNATEISFDLAVGSTGGGTIRFEAVSGASTYEETFDYVVRPAVPVAPLPGGVRDGINYLDDSTVVLTLFAPEKAFVYVIGDFNGWQVDNDFYMNRTPTGDRWWVQLDGLTPGEEYGFQYFVDGQIRAGEPYAEKILDQFDNFIPAFVYPNPKPYPTGLTTGTVAVLQTAQTPYVWQTTDYVRPPKEKLVIYELLVRDFLANHSFRSLRDTLGYLKGMGINAIELMPVNEFSGNISWGYNPTYFFAPDKYYGTKEHLKMLVDAAHAEGMAVILDVVLNHADFECPLVKLWWAGNQPAANSPYFNQQATHPFSVFYDFNHESPATQAFVDSVNTFWLEEYRVDGYRFDLSKGFTQTVTTNVNAWNQYDQSRVDLLTRMVDRLRDTDSSAYIIFEHLGGNQEETVLANYGIMLWGNMHGPYKQNILGFASDANLNWNSYLVRGWNEPNLISYIESHDEERQMYEALLFGNTSNPLYNVRDQRVAYNRIKAAATCYFPIPGPKMLWQFGELGYEFSINRCPNGTISNDCRTDPKPIRWDYVQDPERIKIYKVFGELAKLKTDFEVFSSSDFTINSAGLIQRMQWRHPTMDALVLANFDVVNRNVAPSFPQAGTWYDFFTGEAITVTDPTASLAFLPGEFHLYTTQPLPVPEPNLVEFGPLTSLRDRLAAQALRFYPNPAREQLTLHPENLAPGRAQVRIHNALGATVRTAETRLDGQTPWTLSLTGLPAGFYVMELTLEGRTHVARFVKE